MKKDLEQSEDKSTLDTSDVNPTDLGQDSKTLGKFASVDELAKAYEQLQSAFTKKSQELAEIKDRVSVTKNEPVKEIPQAIAREASDKGGLPTVIAGNSGNYAFTNVLEARTLHATTKVAENFFKLKGEKI